MRSPFSDFGIIRKDLRKFSTTKLAGADSLRAFGRRIDHRLQYRTERRLRTGQLSRETESATPTIWRTMNSTDSKTSAVGAGPSGSAPGYRDSGDAVLARREVIFVARQGGIFVTGNAGFRVPKRDRTTKRGERHPLLASRGVRCRVGVPTAESSGASAPSRHLEEAARKTRHFISCTDVKSDSKSTCAVKS